MAVPWVFLVFDALGVSLLGFVWFVSEFEKPLIYYLLCEKVQLWVYRDGIVLTSPLVEAEAGSFVSAVVLCCAVHQGSLPVHQAVHQELLGNPASAFCLTLEVLGLYYAIHACSLIWVFTWFWASNSGPYLLSHLYAPSPAHRFSKD